MKKDRVLIWGTGKSEKNKRDMLRDMFSRVEIMGYIDNDKSKQHSFYNGYKILSPQEAIRMDFDKILIMSTFSNDIEEQLVNELSVTRDKIDDYKYFTKIRILNRYKTYTDPEIQRVVNHINHNRLEIFSYDFIEKYYNFNVEVLYDETVEMFYVMHHNHPMYFSKAFKNANEVKWYYRSVETEQDENSPHRYQSDDFCVGIGDVVIDAGVAEGNFALDVIDKVSKIYLIESDSKWVDALKVTFADYMDKVVIIDKMLADYDGEETVCLDSVISEKVDFIKMDIEGCEVEALTRMEQLVNISPNLKVAACCYHNEYDERMIKELLQGYRMNTSVTDGYMWYPVGVFQKYYNPKIRRGIVRGQKLACERSRE